jgi:ferric-dicitrate binding protein FerR (iron transport regulator)
MKSVFSSASARAGLLLLLGPATVLLLTAAQRKEARVSQVVRDVNLIAPHAAARPAHLNDTVTEGSAVRTGVGSRTELTFADLTITRVGANSIFSFEENGRNMNVESGAILLRVPKDSGGARIRSSALTVGITGTTVMFEHHRRTYTKLIVLEGRSEAWLTKYPEERVRVRGGQMVVVKTGATHLPEPVDIDLDRLLRSAILITEFPPLPSFSLIRNVANGQKKSGGPLINPLIDLTGMNARDVNASTRAQSTPFKPPGDRNRNP